jgi:outer membrane cobalamin receptor
VQNPRDRGTGGVLPNRARHFGSVGVSYRDRDWSLSLDAFVSGHLPHQGGAVTYPEPGERRSPGRRTLVNLTARYRVSDGFAVFGRVENLLDDDHVSSPTSPAGLPLGVFFGVELDF